MSHTELIFTKPCIHCGETGTVAVKFDQLLKYAEGALIQDAFPNMPIQEREQIISGTHPKCWEEMYPRHTPEESAEDSYFEELWAESQRFEQRWNNENYI